MKEKINTKKNIYPFALVGLVVLIVIVLLIDHNPTKNNNTQNITDTTKSEVEVKIEEKLLEDKNLKENIMEEKISKNGDMLVMNYTGRLQNGKVFDSNILPEFGHVKPFVFVLGAGQVIAGWDEGLLGMKIGEKKTLTIPPEKGYGNRAIGDVIPANSTLIFDVELIDIK